MTSAPNPAAPPSTTHTREAALRSLEAELAALPTERLATYNLNATHAAGVVFDAFARCEPLLDEVAKLFDQDVGPLRRLPVLAEALIQANVLVNIHSAEVSTFDADADAARPIRDYLLKLLDALAIKGKVSQSVLDDIRAGTGRRDLVDDLARLVELSRPFVGTLVEQRELDEASALVDRLSRVLARAKGDDADRSPLLLQRQQVATLMVEAYTELRAAVIYLRRKQGDGAAFAPSLHEGGRPRRRVRPDGSPEPSEALHTPVSDDPRDNPFIDSE
ncbi:MAG: hypothetical protein Q8Q09_14475 [Deltaproteobacteria bacterium]|nr:hypothetical protein [Deltaproteobacteria bacterium]